VREEPRRQRVGIERRAVLLQQLDQALALERPLAAKPPTVSVRAERGEAARQLRLTSAALAPGGEAAAISAATPAMTAVSSSTSVP